MRYWVVVKFTRAHHEDGPTPAPMVYAYASGMNAGLCFFLRERTCAHATATPQHALYLPAAVLVCERWRVKGNLIGIKDELRGP